MRILLNHSTAKKIHTKFPDFVGVLFSPERTRYYEGIPFAIDNGAFGAWRRGEEWNEKLFCSIVEKFADKKPGFVVCPDAIANKAQTLKLWDKWSRWLTERNIPSAFVFTDGMELTDIPNDCAVVFIGGSDHHIARAIKLIPQISKPVHVGRVNYHSRLWAAHNWGAKSCDGTGWFRGDKKQERILFDYFAICSGKQQQESNSLFHIGAYAK